MWRLSLTVSLSLTVLSLPPLQTDRSTRDRIVKLARCREIQCLDRIARQSDEKLFRQIYAMRRFRLSRDKQSAKALLIVLPKNDDEFERLYSLTYSGDDATDEMLSNLYERDWERSVADAVLMLPDQLVDYLNYGQIATTDVHSAYYENASRVCRANRKRFRTSLTQLPRQTQRYLTEHVINPRNCGHYGEEE